MLQSNHHLGVLLPKKQKKPQKTNLGVKKRSFHPKHILSRVHTVQSNELP